MRLGIDIDGVVLDLMAVFCEVCQRHGYQIQYEDIIRHDLGQVLGISRRKLEPLLSEALNSDLVKPYPGAIQGLHRLRAAGHVVELVTGRPESLRERTLEILRRHAVPYDRIAFAPRLGKAAESKCLDLFVEDSLAEALELADNGIEVFIYSHPWNVGSLNVDGRLRYVKDWPELVSEIETMVGAVR